MLNQGLTTWLFPLLLIPFYRLVRPLFRNYIPSMLKCIGSGLLLVIIGYILLEAAGIWGVVLSNGEHRYVTCAELSSHPFFS